MTTIIQKLTLDNLTSTVTLYLIGHLLGAAVPSLPTPLTPYTFDSLCTCLLMHLTSHHYICEPAEKTFRLSIYLRLFTYWGIQFVIFDCQSIWRRNWTVGWTQSTLLFYVIVSSVISISQSNWLDDKRLTSIYYHVDQSNWFSGKGPLSVCHQVFRGVGSMTKVWQILTFNMSSG